MSDREMLRFAVLRRLRLLKRAERTVIVHAAAIGRRFDLDLLRPICGLAEPALSNALERAAELQIVVASGGGRYAFRHALMRDIIYAECANGRVRSLHGRIARVLERSSRSGDSVLANLAYHAWVAGDARRALRYNERAGDEAAAVHALGDAQRYYLRARGASEIGTPAYERLTDKLRAIGESEPR